MSSNNSLPGDDGVMCARLLFACTGHPHALIPWPHRLLHDAVAHIAHLTRRLAEAEECLTIAHMDGYHKGLKAGQSEHNNSVRMGQYILEAKTEKRLREDAEARIADLEEKDEERKAGWQLAGDAARGLRVECDGDLGHEAEQIRAERDALRERCEKLEWLVEVQEFVVYFDPTSTLDNACVELAASWKYAELQAALAATEVPNA